LSCVKVNRSANTARLPEAVRVHDACVARQELSATGVVGEPILPRFLRERSHLLSIQLEPSTKSGSSRCHRGQRQVVQIDPNIGIQHQEIVLDRTYNFRFQKGAYFIQPDVQYIFDPSGTGEIPNALVIGTQLGVNF
jgi:Carbohydrate-selective porin, OprB family